MTPLEMAIEIWELRASGVRTVKPCPLCDGRTIRDGCGDCPVNVFTGTRCEGTPYEDWRKAIGDLNAETEAAKRQLEFLKSLLPVDKNGSSPVPSPDTQREYARSLEKLLARACEILMNYKIHHPAFRVREIGALNSNARLAQTLAIALEDHATRLIDEIKHTI